MLPISAINRCLLPSPIVKAKSNSLPRSAYIVQKEVFRHPRLIRQVAIAISSQAGLLDSNFQSAVDVKRSTFVLYIAVREVFRHNQECAPPKECTLHLEQHSCQTSPGWVARHRTTLASIKRLLASLLQEYGDFFHGSRTCRNVARHAATLDAPPQTKPHQVLDFCVSSMLRI